MRASRVIVVAGLLAFGVSMAGAAEPAKAPTAVESLAEKYAEGLPARETPTRAETIDAYLRGFLEGFVFPSQDPPSDSDPEGRGFQAGQAYRQTNPRKVQETMEGFGYQWTIARGKWTAEFETSVFQPSDRPGQEWSLIQMEGAKVDSVNVGGATAAAASVHVAGFLGPPGKLGDAGLLTREFYAIKITLHDDPPNPLTKRRD